MFFACGIWCVADVSSVSPSSELSVCLSVCLSVGFVCQYFCLLLFVFELLRIQQHGDTLFRASSLSSGLY